MTGTPFFAYTLDFLERYLPLQVCRSAHTVRSYRDALTLFRRYARDALGLGVRELAFADCTKDVVLGFLEHLVSNGARPTTRNQRLSAIKAYLWYAADRDVAIQSVAIAVSHIPPLRGRAEVRETLDADALSALLRAPDPSTAVGRRDRAVLAVLYDAALRLSELTGLSVGDAYVDGPDPHLFVRGKGDRERVVAVTERTAAHIRATISERHGEAPDPAAPLFFVNRGGGRRAMSASCVEDIVRRHSERARGDCPSMPSRVHPHMLRRTRATDLYRDGVPIELVSRILGHSSVDTTRVYATPSMQMLREAMERGSQTVDCEVDWPTDEEELARLCGLR